MRLVFGCDINGISSIKIYNLLHCVCFLNWSSTIEKPIIIQFQFQLNDAFCNKSFTAERDSRKFSFDLRYLLYGRSIKFNLCIIGTRCTIFLKDYISKVFVTIHEVQTDLQVCNVQQMVVIKPFCRLTNRCFSFFSFLETEDVCYCDWRNIGLTDWQLKIFSRFVLLH